MSLRETPTSSFSGASPGSDLPGAGLLARGEAFADVSFWRKVQISGPEPLLWLDNVVSADLRGLQPGHSRRSLLLSPTGRVRAEFTVAVTEAAVLLIQDPMQPRSIGDLLSPYVLSSPVELRDRTGDLALFAFPGRSEPPDVHGATALAPSCVGGGQGVDVLTESEQRAETQDLLLQRFGMAGNEDLEAWRIARGIPRLGTDATEEDLPQEAGLELAVSFDKGCFLGQEAVARVRNLGHPRRVVVLLDALGEASPGEKVMAEGREVGLVTSAVPSGGGGSRVLARVRWGSPEEAFRTERGTELVRAATG